MSVCSCMEGNGGMKGKAMGRERAGTGLQTQLQGHLTCSSPLNTLPPLRGEKRAQKGSAAGGGPCSSLMNVNSSQLYSCCWSLPFLTAVHKSSPNSSLPQTSSPTLALDPQAPKLDFNVLESK